MLHIKDAEEMKSQCAEQATSLQMSEGQFTFEYAHIGRQEPDGVRRDNIKWENDEVA